jgi:diphosphomevalonate decarboxylase
MAQNIIRKLFPDGSVQIKAESPINIALVKYWGKVEEKHIIPANSSMSITIDMEQMKSETTITLRAGLGVVSLKLNGKEAKVTQRIINVIDEIKLQAR